MRAVAHPHLAHRLVIAISLAGALGAPAWAQTLQNPGALQSGALLRQQGVADLRDAQLRAQLNMANRQAVIQQNQLSVQDSQIRTQRALEDIQAQSYVPTVPPVAVGAVIDPGQIPSIPDDKLAASNARVKAAADNH
jgi:hypothetical protein